MLTLENIKPKMKERIKARSDLMKERQEAIIDLLKVNKQLTSREIADETGMTVKNVQYALGPMLEARQVFKKPLPFKERIFRYMLKPEASQDDNDFTRHIEENSTCAQVAESAGITKSTAYKRLEKLRQAGKVKREKANINRAGKMYIYNLT